jgi:YVTN family beta-propeller protein
VTNKIYVANNNDGTVTVIDGASNSTTTVTVGSYPNWVDVNTLTNKVYVANGSDNTVTIIDGATNGTTTIAVGSGPSWLAVNRVTNKIYVANANNNSVSVIDGASNTTTTVAVDSDPSWGVVNPVTNQIYIVNYAGGDVTAIDEQQVQAIPLTTSIIALSNNQTSSPTPSFTFNAQSTTATVPGGVYFQVDTWQGGWSQASGSDPTFTGKVAALQPGFHILYAYAVDGQEATSTQPGSPLTGAIEAYGFLVTQPLTPQTITFNSIPSQIVGTQITLSASASSGLPVSFSSSTTSICTVSGTTASLIAVGTCTIVASQPGNGTYAPATPVSQNFAVNAKTGSSSAKYVGMDASTQGTWTGKYGGDGYLIANDATKPPAYATVSLTGDAAYTWAASTTDARALQTSSGSSSRIASTYYSGSSFTINVNLTDGNTHRVALYLLDWDSSARTETISILDSASNAILDTEKYSNFHNGEYVSWNVSGHVLIQVTKTGGSNAVVSGIFFEAASTALATYIGLDTTTQGTWTNKYGSKGDIIANDANNPPAWATVSFTGDTPYTWAASTTDARALQTSSGSSTRIASTYYAGSSFTINVNLTDGNTHKISLYLLDWDSTARAETVTIMDANSSTVLSTQSYSSFHNGEYAAWNVKGNVLIKVVKSAGSNAVVSGIFFD